MKRRYALWVKTLAFMLLLACLAGAVCGGLLTVFGAQFGLFSGRDFWTSEADEMALYEEIDRWYGTAVQNYMILAADARQNTPDEEARQRMTEIQEMFDPQFNNVSIRYCTDGEVFASLGQTWTDAVRSVRTVVLDADSRAQYGISSIEYGIDSTFPARDGLRWWYGLTQWITGHNGLLIAVDLLTVLGALAALVYLFAACGHRPDGDEIVLRRFDRWPLLIVTGLLIVPFVFGIGVTSESGFYRSWQARLALLCAGGALLFLSALVWLLTVTVRVKAGMLWRTTLLYYLFAAAGRAHAQVRARQADGAVLAIEGAADPADAPDKRHGFSDGLRAVKARFSGFHWNGAGLRRALRAVGRGVRAVLGWLGGGVRAVRDFYGNLSVVWMGGLLGLAVALVNLFVAIVFGLSAEGVLALLVCSAVVLFGLVVLLNQMAALQEGARRLAQGDLEYKIPTARLHGPFREHAQLLGSISDGMAVAVEHRLKSEKLKTELLTNVSHDIKTPLTSIISYVDLLRKTDLQPAQAREYAAVLERQSLRLKKLLEDLIEASKASTGNINVDLAPTDAAELLRQAVGEYSERFKASRLSPVIRIGVPDCTITADGRLLWRVFDNLLGNIVKYALPGTRVYLDLSEQDGKTLISIKNISKDALNIDTDELMERFVRGDAARAGEGSGLGLSIARSLTECMGGAFELAIDGDLFKATLTFDGPKGSAA